MKWLVLLASLILVGCPKVIPSQPIKMTNAQLCKAYGNAQKNSYSKSKMPSLKSEIEKRNLVDASEWSLIDAKEVKIGMSVCALRASWGSAEERSYSSRYGNSIQHIYRLSWCRHCKTQYVYTEGNRVTAIQD